MTLVSSTLGKGMVDAKGFMTGDEDGTLGGMEVDISCGCAHSKAAVLILSMPQLAGQLL
jgi:hypothetical protein